MLKNRSIVQLISWFMILLIFLAVGSLGYLLISGRYARFHQQLADFQKEFIDRQKIELKNQVDQSIEYIDHQLSQSEKLARQMLRQRVDESLQIAATIYDEYHRQLGSRETGEMIKKVLGALRYDGGLGYYFIFDAHGVLLLEPNRKEFEGVSLTALEKKYGPGLMTGFKKITTGPREGFYRYYFSKPGQEEDAARKALKISFIKRFPPYDWYLGTGMYLDEMENLIQEQVNDYLNIHRFGINNQNYVFVIKLLNINGGKNFGIMYANASRPDLIGKYISDDYADARGKYFRREFLRGLREKGECYVTYWYKTIGDNQQPQMKTSYFKLYPPANLIVAAGAYHPDMEKVIAEHRRVLEKNIRHDIRNIIFTLLFIAAALILIVRFMSAKIRREFSVFSEYFDIAARQNQLIDSRSLTLREFQELAGTVNQMVETRREMESSLRNSEEKFRTLTNISPMAIFIHQEGMFVYANPAACRISGYELEELLRMKFWELVHPDMRAKVREFGQRREAGEDVPSRYEILIQTREGQPKWIDFSATTIDYQGKTAIMGNAIDVNERKQAELALVAEKERLAITLSSIGDGVIATDQSGKITLINQAAAEITGWSTREARGRELEKVLDLRSLEKGAAMVDPRKQVLATGTSYHRREQVVLRTKNGDEKIIADSAAPIRSPEGKIIGIIVIIRDITEKVRIRQELQTAQKLESIGLLAGGIAHDFNNLLTAVYGNISLAKMYPDDREKVFYYLEKTEKSLVQAQSLTRQLLTFAKGGEPVRKITAIGPLLLEMAEFSLRGSKIELRVDIAPDLWPLPIDVGQFSQVINNLAINAKQAMPGGGTFIVRAENILLSPEDLVPGEIKAPYVKITLEDQGTGIKPDHLDKVFDPYFTTKQEGSGLGLATVYSIVKNHHGHIKVTSEPGCGTVFTIFLPASPAGRQCQDANSPASREGLAVSKGRVLVMDDEEVVREICGEMLRVMGHEVELAVDGREMLQKYRQAREKQQPFDLVIMDLTVPGGMGGKEAVDLLLEMDPQARAVVSSGYSHDDVMANYRDYGFCGMVTKPYVFADLEKTVQGIIAAAAGSRQG